MRILSIRLDLCWCVEKCKLWLFSFHGVLLDCPSGGKGTHILRRWILDRLWETEPRVKNLDKRKDLIFPFQSRNMKTLLLFKYPRRPEHFHLSIHLLQTLLSSLHLLQIFSLLQLVYLCFCFYKWLNYDFRVPSWYKIAYQKAQTLPPSQRGLENIFPV